MSCRKLNLQNSSNSDSSYVLNEKKNQQTYVIHTNKDNVPHFKKNELNKMNHVQYQKFKLWCQNRLSTNDCANNYFFPK